jgi:small subunit ribosomal protein S1
VLSRRELMEDRRRDRKRELLTEIKVGQVRKGSVKNITDFGVFVDLDGMDGLLHITDMSWGRINHPTELVKVGDELEVVILDVNLEKERVSLGLKQRSNNPWENIQAKYPVGSRLRGKVVNLVPYGAFVEIEQGVEGLVHVSEISWTKRIARASDVLTVGQEVDVVVLNVNREEQKIALGIRQTEENPWDGVRMRYPIGARVSGKVRNLTSYGAFVELEEGIDGMVHVSDMSWTRKINHPSEVLKKGEEVAAVVLEVDPDNQRISLGVKQAQEDPWSTIAARLKIGQMVKGKVTKLASFGAFVEIEEGIDGLVHISQISDDRVEKVKDVLKVGQEVEARIVRIDQVDRKIGLSIKAASVSDEDFVVKDEMLEGLRPGEDLVDLAGAFDAAFGAKEDEWRPGEKSGGRDR